MKKYLAVTVDCDLRCDSVAQRQATLDALLGAFEDTALAGKATWFTNENQFFLTENHETFLREVLRRGDAVGVHNHVDFLDGKRREAALYEYFARSHRVLTGWLRANGRDRPPHCHRMGCLYQREECYAALARLDYTVVSDVYPGYKMPDHGNDTSFDNVSLPPATAPYRHDAGNFLDASSTAGRFLHFPVFHMFLHDLDFSKLREWIETGEKENLDALPFVWIFHPYEICEGLWETRTNDVDPDKVSKLKSDIERMTDEFDLEGINLDACEKIFGG